MDSPKPIPRRPEFGPPRRVVTAPMTLQSTRPRDAHDLVEILYNHPDVRIVAFSATGKTPLRDSRAASSTPDTEDPGSLTPSSQLERTIAFGPFRIYRAPGSVAFLNCGSALKPILPKSQCWCIDEVNSKFVLQIRRPNYWRIELPVSDPEDQRRALLFRTVLDGVLQFEKTECPFKRSFFVELPELSAPVKKKPWTPVHRPAADTTPRLGQVVADDTKHTISQAQPEDQDESAADLHHLSEDIEADISVGSTDTVIAPWSDDRPSSNDALVATEAARIEKLIESTEPFMVDVHLGGAGSASGATAITASLLSSPGPEETTAETPATMLPSIPSPSSCLEHDVAATEMPSPANPSDPSSNLAQDDSSTESLTPVATSAPIMPVQGTPRETRIGHDKIATDLPCKVMPSREALRTASSNATNIASNVSSIPSPSPVHGKIAGTDTLPTDAPITLTGVDETATEASALPSPVVESQATFTSGTDEPHPQGVLEGAGNRKGMMKARLRRTAGFKYAPVRTVTSPPELTLLTSPPSKSAQRGPMAHMAEKPGNVSPTGSQDSFHSVQSWHSPITPLPPSPPMSQPDSPATFPYPHDNIALPRRRTLERHASDMTITNKEGPTWRAVSDAGTESSHDSVMTAPDVSSPPAVGLVGSEMPEGKAATRTTALDGQRLGLNHRATTDSISRRRALSPLPPAANVFSPPSTSERAPHYLSRLESVKKLPMAIIAKTCEMLLGPPSHLIALMLRVAARISAGEWRGRVYGYDDKGDQIPVQWDYSEGDFSEWSDDDDDPRFGHLNAQGGSHEGNAGDTGLVQDHVGEGESWDVD